MTRDKLIEHVGRAMAAAIVSQVRSGATFDETPELMISDEDSNSFWKLLPVARAAIEAIEQTGTGCGVCGCLVYALATKKEDDARQN